MFKIPGLDTYFGSEKSQGCNSVPNIIGFRLADGVFVGVEIKSRPRHPTRRPETVSQ